MTPEIRIAVIGAGSFGQKHLQMVATEPGFAVAGIADPSAAARALAQQLGVPWHEQPGALLDAVRPDGVLVVTPNHLHLPHGLLCIERGIPVLVEKPVADTVERGEQLACAAGTAGVAVLVGHHRRHNPILETAREVVRSGRLGRVVAVNLTWLARKPETYFDVPWRREPGGGPILINLIHEIDALRFVLGEIATVRAMTANAIRGFPVEDTAAVLLRFSSGAIGSVVLSDAAEAPWSWELTSGENPAYPRQNAACGVIAGTQGSLSIPDLELWCHAGCSAAERGWTEPMRRERIPFTPDDAYRRQLRHFGRVIRGEETPRVSVRDASRTLAACLAITESARTGQEVVPGSPGGQALRAACREGQACRIHPGGVRHDPLGQRLHRREQVPPQVGECIFHLRRRHGRHRPGDEAVLLEAPQRRRQHLLADLPDLAAQRVEAVRPPPEHAHHQHRPLVADPRQHTLMCSQVAVS